MILDDEDDEDEDASAEDGPRRTDNARHRHREFNLICDDHLLRVANTIYLCHRR